MKEFFKDYWTLCKKAGKFYRKHCLKILIFELVYCVGIYAIFSRDVIKEKIKNKIKNKYKEEIINDYCLEKACESME